jgi:hypothetical protein
MASTESLKFYEGEDWFFSFTTADEDGEPLDLTGATVLFRLSRGGYEVLTKTADIGATSAAEGLGTLIIEPADQSNIEPQVYRYEIQVTLQDGSKTTQAAGALTVERSLFA